MSNKGWQEIRKRGKITESIIDEVVEGVAVAVVSELVVRGREFLEALQGYACKVAAEVSVLCQDQRPTCDEAVDQGLLPHRNNTNKSIYTRFREIERKRERF